MSIQSEVTRITNDRDTIRAKLVSLGLATSSDKLDALATAVSNIADKGTPAATVQEGQTYTIAAGYYHGGTVTGVGGGGDYTLQAKTVTPTTADQSVGADTGYYGLSTVTVKAIPDNYKDISGVTAGAADVLSGKVIATSAGNVAGTMANNGAISATLTGTATSVVIPAGYHNGSGTVSISTETKTVTPTDAIQDVVPTTGKLLTKVTVAAIPDPYYDVSGVTATAADVLSGKKIVDNDGNTVTGTIATGDNLTISFEDATSTSGAAITAGYYPAGKTIKISNPGNYAKVAGVVTATAADVLTGKTIVGANGATINGSMADNGAVTATITGLGVVAGDTYYTIPAGYHNGSGKVSLTNDIETQLAAV